MVVLADLEEDGVVEDGVEDGVDKSQACPA